MTEDKVEFDEKLIKAGKVAVEFLEMVIGNQDYSEAQQIIAAKAVLDRIAKEESRAGATQVLINFNTEHLLGGMGKIRKITEKPHVLPDNTP